MSLKMSERSTGEILKIMRPKSARRGREARSRRLDEFCQLYGFERKYALKLLGGKRRAEGAVHARSGAKAKYGEAERKVLKAIWLADEQPCGKRRKAAVPIWLPDYEREAGPLEDALRAQILRISAASMDRLLAPCRASAGGRGRCGARPGHCCARQSQSAPSTGMSPALAGWKPTPWRTAENRWPETSAGR